MPIASWRCFNLPSQTVSLLRPTTVISSFRADDDAANMEKMQPGQRRHWLKKIQKWAAEKWAFPWFFLRHFQEDGSFCPQDIQPQALRPIICCLSPAQASLASGTVPNLAAWLGERCGTKHWHWHIDIRIYLMHRSKVIRRVTHHSIVYSHMRTSSRHLP